MAYHFRNPFRPGAGHTPPYLAGREAEKAEFAALLEQSIILENVVLTGLRGIGKTVLLKEFQELARFNDWAWVGSDISESAGAQTEEKLALRVLTDIATIVSSLTVAQTTKRPMGFGRKEESLPVHLDFASLQNVYSQTPGLVSDKLKTVLRLSWQVLSAHQQSIKGVVFAYDEAQNFSDNTAQHEHPLSLFLDVFQSLQRENIPFLLVLTGLPTLFPKLVEARTFAERMFKTIELSALDEMASRDAILKPLDMDECPVRFTDESVKTIVQIANGYPYFIQFICRESYDVWTEDATVPVATEPIMAKLDRDFFSGRWDKATDRQRDIMRLIAHLPNADKEFAIQEIVELSKTAEGVKSFSASHVTQILKNLTEKGLIYRNRHGKYMFAVPLMAEFIRRN